MSFKFTELSTELALEIVSCAATAECANTTTSLQPYYSTASSLASVSYAVRRAAMPHLLETVVLSDPEDHDRFVESIRLQKEFELARPSMGYQRHGSASGWCFSDLSGDGGR